MRVKQLFPLLKIAANALGSTQAIAERRFLNSASNFSDGAAQTLLRLVSAFLYCLSPFTFCRG